LGALDGTHIPAHVTLEDQAKFRNRKGFLSQNVLAVCDFNMNFVYILPGWEGSAHDGRVLLDAQSSHGFITPPGKYWLGDAGYGNTEFILAPYRSVRYHLKEQWLASAK
jgi:DDE superfamily endonuclease